ncbi:MAG: hypothetical protein ACOX2S_10330 [bacterium]
MATKGKLTQGNRSAGIQPAGMADFVRSLIPQDAKINFIFRTDVDGDGSTEGLVGYTVLDAGGHLVSHVLLIRPVGEGFISHKLLATSLEPDSLYDADDGLYGTLAASYLADTNGDGRQDLVVGLAAGRGHYLKAHIIRFGEEQPALIWSLEEGAYHGSLDVLDVDGDKVSEIIVEGSTWCGEQILSLAEADPHVRLSTCHKWNGQSYSSFPYQVKQPENASYNVAVAYLGALWEGDYQTAYNLTQLPGFLGLKGLDDSSLDAFREHVDEHIMPELLRNLEKGRLQPQDVHPAYCFFAGINDLIQVSLEHEQGEPKVASIQFIPL